MAVRRARILLPAGVTALVAALLISGVGVPDGLVPAAAGAVSGVPTRPMAAPRESSEGPPAAKAPVGVAVAAGL